MAEFLDSRTVKENITVNFCRNETVAFFFTVPFYSTLHWDISFQVKSACLSIDPRTHLASRLQVTGYRRLNPDRAIISGQVVKCLQNEEMLNNISVDRNRQKDRRLNSASENYGQPPSGWKSIYYSLLIMFQESPFQRYVKRLCRFCQFSPGPLRHGKTKQFLFFHFDNYIDRTNHKLDCSCQAAGSATSV